MRDESRITDLVFDSRGLIPAVAQDASTGEVLMVAWMNDESLRLTRETGEAHFWSRSRNELWRKGATSGNVLKVEEIRVDCDADTLLLRVHPTGPACHTGARSCFFRVLVDHPTTPLLGGYGSVTARRAIMLAELFSIIEDRKAHPAAGSYTNRLLNDVDELLKKFGEEAVEVVVAAKGQGDRRIIEEMADLFYHALVVLSAYGLSLSAVEEELRRRQSTDRKRTSG
ncbi:MAG TPA: bifunctional phosphoribosyl-AMP cyclohydrolase/phosphoribosyl-ATP diphosphatase HisIE [Anaerolineae bacterium]